METQVNCKYVEAVLNLTRAADVPAEANLGRPSDEEQMKKFIEALKLGNGSAGNVALREKLGWTEDEYWRIRERLLESGTVRRGRGRGGAVSLVDQEPMPAAPIAAVQPELREENLYEPCLGVLKDKWSQEVGLRDVHIEITARQGGRKTGGVWTRPDIAAISMRTFSHWPGRIFDIWTFEIKPRWQFNVSGVFEAAAHGRAATHSYVIYETDEGLDENDADVLRLISEAQRLGVGVIFFEKADDFETWDIQVDAVRRQPDPSLLEEFVVTQLSDEARNLLLRWGK